METKGAGIHFASEFWIRSVIGLFSTINSDTGSEISEVLVVHVVNDSTGKW